MTRVRLGAAAVLMGGVLATAAACSSSGGSSSGGSTSGGSSTSPPAATGRSIQVHSGAVGRYLTDGSGRSLYMFASDTATRSTCAGVCLTYWPAFHAPATAGGGTVRADVGIVRGTDGGGQVSYHGHPLYYYAGDTKPDQTNGQGLSNFGAKWWLVSPAGAPITSAPASSASSSGGGYGY